MNTSICLFIATASLSCTTLLFIFNVTVDDNTAGSLRRALVSLTSLADGSLCSPRFAAGSHCRWIVDPTLVVGRGSKTGGVGTRHEWREVSEPVTQTQAGFYRILGFTTRFTMVYI